MTGNYRCVKADGPVAIRDAVHGDLEASRNIYAYVDKIAQTLGADPADQVPFEKYSKAAESLLKPSSVARAIAAGAPAVERVDELVQIIGEHLGQSNETIDEIVATVDKCLTENELNSPWHRS